jgi:hypothetical protein
MKVSTTLHSICSSTCCSPLLIEAVLLRR